MSDVLVLNKQFTAIHVADWKQTMSLLFQGHAEAVDASYQTYGFEDWCELSNAMVESPSGFVHTATLRIAIPEVIRLTRYEKLPSADIKFTRSNLYEHYKNKCSYCGDKFQTRDLNLDHVIPRSRGGGTNWDNIVLSCIPCNKKKADKSPAEAGMKLLVTPTKPRWRGPSHMIMSMHNIKVRDSWQSFIDQAYWNSELRPD